MENPRLERLDPIGSLWRESWNLFKERAWPAVEMLLVPTILTIAGALFALAANERAQFIGILFRIAGAILSVPAGAGIILLLHEDGPVKKSAGAFYKQGFELFWPLVWVSLLVTAITAGGFLMLIIPGILIGAWLVFANYTLVIEGKRGLGALLQSRGYVEGYWWAIVGRFFLFMIFAGIIYIVLVIIAFILAGPIGALLLPGIVVLFLTPFSVAYLYTIFKNLRKIKPELAATPAVKGRTFFIASGIVGLVAPILIVILIIAAFGVGIFWAATHVPVNGQAPAILSLEPSSGPVGAHIFIYGFGFGATNTIEFDGRIGPSFINVSAEQNGTELAVPVPPQLSPYCDPGALCPNNIQKVTPGTYQVTVMANGTTSNALPFTVTVR